MPKLVIESGGRRRTLSLDADRLTVGRAADADIVVAGRGVADEHLVLVRHGRGFRALAARGTAGFVVNGARAARHDLQAGDRLELGSAVLEYFADEGESNGAAAHALDLSALADEISVGLAVRPRAARAPDKRDARGRSPRQRKRPWALASAAICLSGAVVFAVIQLASSDRFGKSALALVTLAETQASQGRFDDALATLAAARDRGADAELAARADDLAGRIAKTLALREDDAQLHAAWTQYRNLVNFEAAYLKADSTHRPACRELVRRAREWLATYGELCAKYPQRAAEAREVDTMAARYAAAARLEEPDGVDDAMFLAQHRVRLKRRRYYRESLARLDSYLQSGATERVDEVRQLREQIAADGESWCKQQLERAALLIERRDFAAAEEEIDFLREHGLPSWGSAIDVVAARLQEARARD